ncbi:MAG: PEP-CTERM sorting domain-containing protein [Verrucomicrobiota bacterium]
MKTKFVSILVSVLMTSSISLAVVVVDGDLNSLGDPSSFTGNTGAGNAILTLDGSNNVTINGTDTGIDANGGWIRQNLSQGFTYNAAGGDTGEGGAFVQNGTTFGDNYRAVGQFNQDSKATTGLVDVSIDVFLDDNSTLRELSFNVELFGWDTGDTAPGLSYGGAASGYNVTNLGGATALINSQITQSSVTNASWETVTVSSSLDLGTGYDYYAWRIGVFDANNNDVFAFDNVSVTAVPEPSSFAMIAIGLLALLGLRRFK